MNQTTPIDVSGSLDSSATTISKAVTTTADNDLVVAALALVQGLIDIRQRLQSGVAAASAFYGICLLFAVAVGFLFTPDAAPWFKKPANP